MSSFASSLSDNVMTDTASTKLDELKRENRERAESLDLKRKSTNRKDTNEIYSNY